MYIQYTFEKIMHSVKMLYILYSAVKINAIQINVIQIYATHAQFE